MWQRNKRDRQLCSPSRVSQHWPAALWALTSSKLLSRMVESSFPNLALQ